MILLWADMQGANSEGTISPVSRNFECLKIYCPLTIDLHQIPELASIDKAALVL
jgi:hypothetical protein